MARLAIGAATRTFGITARALHYYEQRKLVSAARDRGNMRYYDPEACKRIAWIVRLREAKVALTDIASLLELEGEASRHDQARALISARHKAMRRELAIVEATLAELKSPDCGSPFTSPTRPLHGGTPWTGQAK